GDNTWRLSLSNSGRKFPENIDIAKSDSYGMQILTAFTQQLKGSLRLEIEPQTTFILDFPTDSTDFSLSPS
ncbi:MAG TPA: hypothetical protein DCO79_02675, partial [Spirochaeta sp.]|nr:hypothetical protein [Spirochaeta sp.]